MHFFKTAAIILVTLAGSFGASQLAYGTPLSAGALPLSENVDMSMVSKSRWRGGGYRGYRGGYRGYRGVIEVIGASAPTAIAMAIVRIVDMAQLVRPRGTMAAAGLIHTTTHIRAFVAPLAGIMAPAASMALGSTVAGDTPTGDIAAATVAVCTGDGRSPCGAGTAGASPAAEDRQRLLSQASDRRRAGKLLEGA